MTHLANPLYIITNGKYKNIILQKQNTPSFSSVLFKNNISYCLFKNTFMYINQLNYEAHNIKLKLAPAHCYCYYKSINIPESQIYKNKTLVKTSRILLDLLFLSHINLTFRFELEKNTKDFIIYVNPPVNINTYDFIKLTQKFDFTQKSLYKPVMDYVYKAYRRKNQTFIFKWNNEKTLYHY